MNKLLLAILTFSLLACSDAKKTAGTATDTGNTLSGIVLLENGKPASGVEILVITNKYGFSTQAVNPLSKKSAELVNVVYSEADGSYEMPLPESEFSLQFTLRKDNEVLGIALLTELDPLRFEEQDVPEVQLGKPASIQTQLNFKTTGEPLADFGGHYRVGVMGSNLFYEVMVGEPFLMENLPSGEVTLVYYPANEYLITRLESQGVSRQSLIKTLTLELSPNQTSELPQLLYTLPPEAVKNTLFGTVVDSAGNPVPGVFVHVITDPWGFYTSSEYFPGGKSVVVDTTDSSGQYSFTIPDTLFNIEFIQTQSDSDSTWISGVALLKDHDPADYQAGDNLADVELSVPAEVHGILSYAEEYSGVYDFGNHFRVGIAGTSRYIDVIPGELFVITGLYAGSPSDPSPQVLVAYPADRYLLGRAQEEGVPLVDFILQTDITLFAGQSYQMQGITYSLPSGLQDIEPPVNP
jgi:hypothetical protein